MGLFTHKNINDTFWTKTYFYAFYQSYMKRWKKVGKVTSALKNYGIAKCI